MAVSSISAAMLPHHPLIQLLGELTERGGADGSHRLQFLGRQPKTLSRGAGIGQEQCAELFISNGRTNEFVQGVIYHVCLLIPLPALCGFTRGSEGMAVPIAGQTPAGFLTGGPVYLWTTRTIVRLELTPQIHVVLLTIR